MHDSTNSGTHQPAITVASEELSSIEIRLLSLYRQLSAQDQFYLRRLAEAMGVTTDTDGNLGDTEPEDDEKWMEKERKNESYSVQRVQA